MASVPPFLLALSLPFAWKGREGQTDTETIGNSDDALRYDKKSPTIQVVSALRTETYALFCRGSLRRVPILQSEP